MRRFINSTTLAASKDMVSLFRHTSGRWLWNEDEQMRLRCRQFDILSLQQAVSNAMGGVRCKLLTKIGEGNYNKAYSLETEDGRKVIAKIPNPNVSPPMLTTASEVATMDFARNVLGLPVPKVLAWDASDQNPVGAEYIVMEEAIGSPLHEVWKTLQLRIKCEIMDRIVDIEKKLLSASFDRIGSLYFDDGRIRGCVPASITIGSQPVDDRVRSQYCIGPIVRREFWEKERQTMYQYHGPWNSSIEYLKSIAHREIDWIERHASHSASERHPYQFTSKNQNSHEAHVTLLQKFLSIVPDVVPKDSQITSPTLWHPDFHPGNIYVDNDYRISSFIDWQGSWLTPAFIGANPPLLLDYGIEILMKLPDDFKRLEEVDRARLRHQVSESILIGSYETSTLQKNPIMHRMMRHPHGQTLKHLETFAGSTWDHGIFPLEDCLIRIEREWDHFKVDTPCPYRFTDEEVKDHNEEVDSFNKHQEFWTSLRGIMTDEGYVSNEDYIDAIDIFQTLQKSK